MIYVATPLYPVWMCTSKIVVTPVPITAIYVNATRYALFPGVRCVGWRWRGVSLYLTTWLDCCFYRSDRVLCETHCLAGTLPGVLCLNELLSSNALVPKEGSHAS